MYYKNNGDFQSVKWSMIVLFFSLVLVYMILYYVNEDLWKNDLFQNNVNTGNIYVSQIEQNYIGSGEDLDGNTDVNIDNEIQNGGNYELITGGDDEIADLGNQQEDEINIDDGEIVVLSGTKTYYGDLDFVEKLGISYKYVLRDQKGIYYLNMGNYDYDFADIARKLGGSLYVMNTDQELVKNALFGDKVTFINIPEYKNKKVLFLLEIYNQSWLLAIDYDLYHQVKPYLKSLFIYN